MHYSDWRKEDQLTAIAWSWTDSTVIESRVLDQDLGNEQQMLEDFLAAFHQADMVTGHYLTKHDLPLVNEHCLRFGLGLLPPVLVQDTHRMTSTKGLGKSQENLASTFGVDETKHRMCGHAWRVANSLNRDGRDGARRRVVSDVHQHKALREKLADAGALKRPVVWRP